MNGIPIAKIDAKYEAGTDLVINDETVELAEFWEDEGCDFVRQGSMVFLAFRLNNENGSTNPICTLPPDFRPAVEVKNAASTLTVKTNGEVEISEVSVAEIAYRAAA